MHIFILFLQLALASQPIVPKVELSFWNSSEVQDGNNCYNYSTNRVTNSFAQPGESSGKMYENLTCKDVLKAAAADLGLKRTKFFAFNGKEDESLIALVVAPGEDFHWYRRGDDGMWTHKPGSLEATNQDESAHEIADPEKADRGIYSDFCGYFRIKNYRYQSNEQNGGYVRIGSMTDMPELPKESTVTVMMYSGRRNPQFPLKELLANPDAKAQLEELRNQIGALPLSVMPKQSPPSRLGYSGLKIVDREGLIFAQGSEVVVQSQAAFVRGPMAVGSIRIPLAQPMRFERKFFQQFNSHPVQ